MTPGQARTLLERLPVEGKGVLVLLLADHHLRHHQQDPGGVGRPRLEIFEGALGHTLVAPPQAIPPARFFGGLLREDAVLSGRRLEAFEREQTLGKHLTGGLVLGLRGQEGLEGLHGLRRLPELHVGTPEEEGGGEKVPPTALGSGLEGEGGPPVVARPWRGPFRGSAGGPARPAPPRPASRRPWPRHRSGRSPSRPEPAGTWPAAPGPALWRTGRLRRRGAP